jgi:hypothetical protein
MSKQHVVYYPGPMETSRDIESVTTLPEWAMEVTTLSEGIWGVCC